MNDEKLFVPVEEAATLDDVAAFFKISRNTLARWRKKPGFPKPTSMVDGSRMLFRVSDLVAYRDRRLRTPAKPIRRAKKVTPKTKEPAKEAGPAADGVYVSCAKGDHDIAGELDDMIFNAFPGMRRERDLTPPPAPASSA